MVDIKDREGTVSRCRDCLYNGFFNPNGSTMCKTCINNTEYKDNFSKYPIKFQERLRKNVE